jgi:DNA-binding beta-propeller fold protein YncE
MKALRLGWACALALLVGCAGATPQSTLPGTPLQTGAREPAVRSWMSPEAAAHDLLYVSDDAGAVYVFTYPAGKLVGTIAGLDGPAGLCTDSKGDVFVPNTSGGYILEYAHGGHKPIGTLLDFGAFPDGCAVDPVTGNLAVTNFATNPSQSAGNVAIYPNAQGNPTFYTAKNFNEYLFCSYDASGNLLVDGVNAGTTQSEIAELPSGGSALVDVAINTTLGFPGAVQWDGKYFAIEDLLKGDLYRVAVSGSSGTVAGTVHLNVRSRLVVQFWIQGNTIVVPYGATSRVVKKVGLWKYPGGGSVTKSFGVNGATELVGAAVSLAK